MPTVSTCGGDDVTSGTDLTSAGVPLGSLSLGERAPLAAAKGLSLVVLMLFFSCRFGIVRHLRHPGASGEGEWPSQL